MNLVLLLQSLFDQVFYCSIIPVAKLTVVLFISSESDIDVAVNQAYETVTRMSHSRPVILQ